MDFDLRDRTVLLTLAGSRAYGLHGPGSDVDVKGVAVPPKRWFLGFLKRFEQADAPDAIRVFTDDLPPDLREAAARTKLEGSVYHLVKFVSLAVECNPNLLDVLFCRDADVLLTSAVGRRLREARDLFVTARAKHTYAGYAASQLKRIRTHRRWLRSPPTEEPTRAAFGLPDPTPIPRGQRSAVESAARRRANPELDDALLEILRREQAYRAARDEWQRHRHWLAARNPERAALEARFGYDTRHGAHLVRLYRMAREILETGRVHVWRGPGEPDGPDDRDELLAVRRGAWSYDALVAWADAQQAALDDLERGGRVAVPEAPDRERIDALCVDLVETVLREGVVR